MQRLRLCRMGKLIGSRRGWPWLVALALCVASPVAHGGDWPQILGPQRNGIAEGEQLQAWSDAGPAEVWSRKVGQGFAGLAVVGRRAVLFHRIGGELVAEGLDAATGKSHWKVTYETRYRGSISPDNGPRCVPLVHEGHVYLYGPSGELACVALDSGKKIWARQVNEEFGAPDGYFGAGSSPIVADGKLLLNVGGRRRRHRGLLAQRRADVCGSRPTTRPAIRRPRRPRSTACGRWCSSPG